MPDSSSTPLKKAIAHHRAGQLSKAEKLYKAALKAEPKNVDALNLIGILAHQRGRFEEALKFFDEAITSKANVAEVYYNKANVLKEMGRTGEAEATYRTAITIKADYIEAHLNLGAMLHANNQIEAATKAFRTLTKRCPSDARGHYNLGKCLHQTGKVDEAGKAFDAALKHNSKDPDIHFAVANLHADMNNTQGAIKHIKTAIQLKPNWPQAYSNLGELLVQQKAFSEALEAHKKAVSIQPEDPGIHYNYGRAFYGAEFFDEAEGQFKAALEIDPNFVEAYVNLGNVYRQTRKYDEALWAYETALSINPNLSQAYSNIGSVMQDKDWLHSAITAFDKALKMDQDIVETKISRSLARLKLGDLSSGWLDHESRFLGEDEHIVKRVSPPAYWKGEDLDGKAVLVWTEQGLGDEILQSSMIPDLATQAQRCIVECSTRLAPVFARSFANVEVASYERYIDSVTPAKNIDYQISSASLGQYLRPNFDSFTPHTGYLKADQDKTAALRNRYQSLGPGRRIVGLSWRSQNAKLGIHKTSELADWAPILTVPDVTFINLQYGDCEEELNLVKDRLGVEVHHDDSVDPLVDMDTFFAQVAAMDLVISTSNTTVHTAGAMGAPVWTLLPKGVGSIWYWFLRREDSPWYPSMRLFRQSYEEGQDIHWWDGVVARAGDALKTWMKD